MAAAPLALTAGVQPASEAVEAVSKVLTGDLLVVKGKVYRERHFITYGPDLTPKTGRPVKHTLTRLEPVDLELHVNPVTIAVTAAAVGAGLIGLSLAAWWAGLGVKLDPKVEGRLGDVKILIRVGEDRVAELNRTIAFSGATDPQDPLIFERNSILAQLKELRKERSRLRRGLLKLETRPRMGQNLFRIF